MDDCCQEKKESKGILSGIIYGLIPHTGCIAFIVLTILGVTTAASLFKPLLMNAYFFYILIGLSLVFAGISGSVYLKKRNMLSTTGVKQKWKYLSVLFGTTIGVNLLLFMVIFPITANMTMATPTGAAIYTGSSNITLKVDIPCPGHAPLISEELKTINGVQSIKFRFPNNFDVQYDSSETSQNEILKLEVFNTYQAQVLKTSEIKEQPIATSSCCGSCSAARSGSSCGCGGVR